MIGVLGILLSLLADADLLVAYMSGVLCPRNTAELTGGRRLTGGLYE